MITTVITFCICLFLLVAGAMGAPKLVTVQWAHSTSAYSGYNVYRSDKPDGPYRKVNKALVKDNNYEDAEVKPGQTYYYKATTVSPDGRESRMTKEIKTVVPKEN